MHRTFRSFAKINLHLQVDARRSDGYHELRTVFQTVDLHDVISLTALDTPGISLQVPGGGAPEDESNLAYQAARRLLDLAPSDRGLRIELHKRIPAGGGLGGGSGNAATVLLGAREVLGLEVTDEALARLGRELGADVPFFFVGGTALGVGRGDEIVALPEMPSEEVLLVDPGVAVSTAEVFGALPAPRARPLPGPIEGLVGGRAPGSIAELEGFNDLESTVLEGFPAVRSVYNALRRAGADVVRLSGSGATVFACFADPQRASKAQSNLPSGAKAVNARTLSRSVVMATRSVGVPEGD